MSNTPMGLKELSRRAEQGDREAAQELRRRLEGSLGPIVRGALRGGGPLSAPIQALARRTAVNAEETERVTPGLVAEVSRTLTARVLDRLSSRADSVRVGCETVGF